MLWTCTNWSRKTMAWMLTLSSTSRANSCLKTLVSMRSSSRLKRTAKKSLLSPTKCQSTINLTQLVSLSTWWHQCIVVSKSATQRKSQFISDALKERLASSKRGKIAWSILPIGFKEQKVRLPILCQHTHWIKLCRAWLTQNSPCSSIQSMTRSALSTTKKRIKLSVLSRSSKSSTSSQPIRISFPKKALTSFCAAQNLAQTSKILNRETWI